MFSGSDVLLKIHSNIITTMLKSRLWKWLLRGIKYNKNL